MMEWSKEKTFKLIELMQANSSLWNPSLCDSRKDKVKRKEELRSMAAVLRVSVADVMKKIQHLRTQYNRESARVARANAETPNDVYVSHWYAFEYLHFLKDSNKPFRVLHSENHPEEIITVPLETNGGCKTENYTPANKQTSVKSSEFLFKQDMIYSSPLRDDLSVFGEYIANELRSLKGEKSLLLAKKKIQDVIFEVKMNLINEPRPDQNAFTIYTHKNMNNIDNGKLYSQQQMSTNVQIEPLPTPHTPPTSGISEIIINGACHYSTFKVDNQ